MNNKNQTKLQIPISKKTKKDLEKKCEELGFYSANDVIRFMIQNFISGKLNLEFMTGSQSSNEFETSYSEEAGSLDEDEACALV